VASPDAMDDDKDCAPQVGEGIVDPLLKDMIDAQVGVVSLSADKSDYLMWDRYTGGHRGICVEIDARFLISQETTQGVALLPVKYADSLAVLGPSTDYWATRNAVALLTVKRTHYSYEKEWRLTKMWDTLNSVQRCLNLGQELVTAVLVGKKILESDRQRIKLWISRREVAIPLVEAAPS